MWPILFIILLVGIWFFNRRHKKQIQRNYEREFKDLVVRRFQADYKRAWNMYVPTEVDIQNWVNVFQSLDAQTHTSLMLTDVVMGSGRGFQNNVAMIDASWRTSGIVKKRNLMAQLVGQSTRVITMIDYGRVNTDQFIEAVAQLAYLRDQAIHNGLVAPTVNIPRQRLTRP